MNFYRLNVLCIFLDREGLGYTREIANIWAEGLGATLFGKSKVTALYHTLDLFDDYLAKTAGRSPQSLIFRALWAFFVLGNMVL